MDLESILLGSELICAAAGFGAGMAVGYNMSGKEFHYEEDVLALRDTLGIERPSEKIIQKQRSNLKAMRFHLTLGFGAAVHLAESLLNGSAYHPLGQWPKWIAGIAGAYLGLKLGGWWGLRRRKHNTNLTEKEQEKIMDYRNKISESMVKKGNSAYDKYVHDFAVYWNELAFEKMMSKKARDKIFTDFLNDLGQKHICHQLKEIGFIEGVYSEGEIRSTVFGNVGADSAALFVINLGKTSARGQVEKFYFEINEGLGLALEIPSELDASVVSAMARRAGAFEWDTTVKDLSRILTEQTEVKKPYVISCGDKEIPLDMKLAYGAQSYLEAYVKNKKEKEE